MTNDVSLRNLQPKPFVGGNQAARTHAFFAKHLSDTEAGEIAALTEAYRERCPAYSQSLDPLLELAGSVTWRIQLATRDLAKNGLTRGTKSAPVLKHLEAAERTLVHILGRLGMSTMDAASLGLTLTRARRESFDLKRLSIAKQEQLRELLQEAGALDG